jgi:hypothetical protein
VLRYLFLFHSPVFWSIGFGNIPRKGHQEYRTVNGQSGQQMILEKDIHMQKNEIECLFYTTKKELKIDEKIILNI